MFQQIVVPNLVLYLSQHQDNSEIHFKVKMTTHLKKLKESYSQRQVDTQKTFWSVENV